MARTINRDEKVVTFRIPTKLIAELEKLAKADERPTSFLLRKAVEQYLANAKKSAK